MCTPQRTVKPSCHRAVYIVRAICFERAVGNTSSAYITGGDSRLQ